MTKPRKQLTRLELQLMKVLWDVGPSNVQGVQDNLPASLKLAYTTVQTMLNVLYRKQWVKRTLRGRAYEYEPLVSRERAASGAIRDMIDRLFGGSVESLVMSLIESKQLNLKKLEKLRTLVDEQERSEKAGHHGND